MFIHKPNRLHPVGGTETPEPIALHRRKWLKLAGGAAAIGACGAAGWYGCQAWQGSDHDVIERGEVRPAGSHLWRSVFPARRDERFRYDRAETDPIAAARYTNFYEFSRFKWCWRYVEAFQPEPWTITLDGLCAKPLRLDLDALHSQYAASFCERQYRHRCVETWAMAIPWAGFPLADIVRQAEPRPEATHVRFVSFLRPDEAPHQASSTDFPWPYTEGLTLDEAMNPLTFLATGMYGKPLLRQHGAPVRLVVPWKYGFKSIKSIERIEFVAREPATFWSTMNPEAYPFESNVDPSVPRPWPQHTERMLGTDERIATRPYNGYGAYVEHLYRG